LNLHEFTVKYIFVTFSRLF